MRLASERFSTVGIEVYPMNSDEYAHIHDCGADYVTVFQETYDPIRYEQLHLAGPKRIFSYRFDAQERALRGGMRGVAFGTLLGLRDDFSSPADCTRWRSRGTTPMRRPPCPCPGSGPRAGSTTTWPSRRRSCCRSRWRTAYSCRSRDRPYPPASISDPRDLAEITEALRRKGLQPVMTDYVRT